MIATDARLRVRHACLRAGCCLPQHAYIPIHPITHRTGCAHSHSSCWPLGLVWVEGWQLASTVGQKRFAPCIVHSMDCSSVSTPRAVFRALDAVGAGADEELLCSGCIITKQAHSACVVVWWSPEYLMLGLSAGGRWRGGMPPGSLALTACCSDLDLLHVGLWLVSVCACACQSHAFTCPLT